VAFLSKCAGFVPGPGRRDSVGAVLVTVISGYVALFKATSWMADPRTNPLAPALPTGELIIYKMGVGRAFHAVFELDLFG